MRLRGGMILGLLAVLCLPAWCVDESPVLERVRTQMSQLVPLMLGSNGKLAIDYQFWDAEIERVQKATDEEKEKMADEIDSTPPEIKARMKELHKDRRRHMSDLTYYPLDKNIAEMFKIVSGGRASGGYGRSNDEVHYDKYSDSLSFHLKLSIKGQYYETKVIERGGPQRFIQLEDAKDGGVFVRYANGRDGTQVLFSQSGYGKVVMVVQGPEINEALFGESLTEIIQKHTDKVQRYLLRPLFDIGMEFAPHKDLPVVMAVASGGFSPPAPEIAKQCNDLLKELDSDDMDTRDRATAGLIAIYPRSIKLIRDALAATKDAENKRRLTKVVNAHPGIAKALPYVEQKKLHEDKAYLLHILANVPFFKAQARARLTLLYGKDHGEDPKGWPAP